MALDVRLTFGATTYRLLADKANIAIKRYPVLASPGGALNPITVELGQFNYFINVRGKVEEAATTEDGVTIPSKVQLEDVIIDQWNATISIQLSGDSYTGKIQDANFELIGGVEDRWEYSITFTTNKRT